MAKKPVKKQRQSAPPPESALDFEDEILSRFLVDKKGNILGESIGIDGEDLILKHKTDFYLIPRSSVALKGKKLVLKKKVDWIAAKAKGKGWKKEELDPLWGKDTPKAAKKKAPSKKKAPTKKTPVKNPVEKKIPVKKPKSKGA